MRNTSMHMMYVHTLYQLFQLDSVVFMNAGI